MRKPETAALESDTVPRFLFKKRWQCVRLLPQCAPRRRMQLGGNSPRLPGRIRSPACRQPAPFQATDQKCPGGEVIRCFEPDIGGVHSAPSLEACAAQPLRNHAGISLIITNDFAHLAPACIRINRLCRALGNIRDAIELGCLPARPEVVERNAVSLQLFGDNRVGTAYARKAGSFGIASEFNRTVFAPSI